jgi:peptidoglycan/LPS O-acetylase OafA/YrhL
MSGQIYRKELDGIRAIAAFMILVYHFFKHFDGNSILVRTIGPYTEFLQYGVSLFFVLSGFLISRILISTRQDKYYFRQFYIRRVLRIFPLYYLFLVIYYFIQPFIFQYPVVPFSNQVYFWTYLQNFATTFEWPAVGPIHFWSLSIEEHFYLFWPLIIYYCRLNKLQYAMFLTILIAVLVRILLISNGYKVFYFTFARMDELAAGGLLAILELKNKLLTTNSKKFLITGIAIIILTAILWTIFDGKENPVIQVLKYLMFSGVFFSLIGYVICLPNDHYLKKILMFPFLQYSGKISYGLYVFHLLCFELFSNFLKTPYSLINFAGSVGLTFLVASISYHFFEKKFLQLKRFFEYNQAVPDPSKKSHKRPFAIPPLLPKDELITK